MKIIYTLFGGLDEAQRIAKVVIEEKLAGCVNIMSLCQSIYSWEGKVESSEEIPAFIKTAAAKEQAVMTRIAELHSYDTPCIISWDMSKMAPDYLRWLQESIGE